MDYKIGLAAIAILAAVVASNTWASDSTVRAEEALIVQGNKHWEEGRLGDAQKSFEQAVVADPSSIDAHMKLGGLQLSNPATLWPYGPTNERSAWTGTTPRHGWGWVWLICIADNTNYPARPLARQFGPIPVARHNWRRCSLNVRDKSVLVTYAL